MLAYLVNSWIIKIAIIHDGQMLLFGAQKKRKNSGKKTITYANFNIFLKNKVVSATSPSSSPSDERKSTSAVI